MSGESEQGFRGDTTYGEPAVYDERKNPRQRGTDLIHNCAICGKSVVDNEASGIYLHGGPVPTHPSCGREEGKRMILEAGDIELVGQNQEAQR